MTTPTIDIPDNKTELLKQLVTELGGSYHGENRQVKGMTYKEKIPSRH